MKNFEGNSDADKRSILEIGKDASCR